MRTGCVAYGIVIACALAPLAAQDPKPRKDTVKSDIVVTGCIDGSWLRVSRVEGTGASVERYKLRGSKQLLKELEKKYAGHSVEVAGKVTDTGNTTHAGKTIEIGKKTRIYTGAKEAPQQPTGTGDPILEVESFRDLSERCK